MEKNRPVTTLFMISSVDGKISTGDTSQLDVDKDFPRIEGIKEGLFQYYDLEKKTDWVSFNSGKVQAKVGANQRKWERPNHDGICFVVVDNEPHLNLDGVEYFAKRSEYFYLVTSNPKHPAFEVASKYPTMRIMLYEENIDFAEVFRRFKEEYGVERVTIQTGGELNAVLLRSGLIDYVSLVVAPCLIGGDKTKNLIGGESLHTEEDLSKIKALKLIKADVLKDSYLHLSYEVINDTKIDRN